MILYQPAAREMELYVGGDPSCRAWLDGLFIHRTNRSYDVEYMRVRCVRERSTLATQEARLRWR